MRRPEEKLTRLKAEASTIRKEVIDVESEIDRRLDNKSKQGRCYSRTDAVKWDWNDLNLEVSTLMPSRSAIEGYFNLNDSRMVSVLCQSEASFSADLGGSSKYSNENFED